MNARKGKFIFKETSMMHDEVTEIYEALMEEDNKEAIKVLDSLAEKVRALKSDLLTKED